MRIADFLDKNIEITWTLLLICFDSNNLLRNCEYDQKFIAADEILNYSTANLEYSDNPLILALAIKKEHDSAEILDLLRKLSQKENSDYGLEFRKFRAMYVYKNLPRVNDDFIYGLLKINEIWDSFGFPKDSPACVLKFKDYSQDSYNEILDINITWLLREFMMISSDAQMTR